MEKLNQMEAAKRGIVTDEMIAVAKFERRDGEWIRERVANGRIVVPANKLHTSLKPMGIGRELKTKINANIGTSPTSSCIAQELTKLDAAISYGADTVMDLSTGDNLDQTRRTIIAHSVIPVGTVPIYELACRCGSDDAIDFSKDAILSVIRDQAEQGVDYMTMHCGIRPSMLPAARVRKLRIVSRGGALIARYIAKTGNDNPFYDYFDDILEICRQYDVTISLGDGLRPGCLA
ncbi:MAG: phosphomethylpyrimidine synthase ThiC, partial [Victivallales bacterium]|nr:phosphomethylpyrimidine synthase ThiC [Victivallales bacterium]